MSSMLMNCVGLDTIVSLNKFDTKNVIDMTNMFRFCTSLVSLDTKNKQKASLDSS